MKDKTTRVWTGEKFWYFTYANILTYPEELTEAIINGYPFDDETGLYDKNSKPIFEHDILKDGKGGLGLVVYSSVNAAFVVKADGKEWWLNEGNMSRGNTLEYTEIVGDLYTTPELRKE